MQMDLLDEEKEAQNCFYKIEKKLKKIRKGKKQKWKPTSKLSYLSIALSARRDIYAIVQLMNVAAISTVAFICLAFCQKGCF